MRAIVILFNGDFTSEIHEKDFVNTCMSTMARCTNSEGEAKVITLNHQDVAKLLIKEIAGERKEKNSFEEELAAYCNTVLRRTSIISTDTEQEKKFLFLKAFFNDSKLREPKRVLHWLKGCANPTDKCQNILDSNGLSNLPTWIKEIVLVTNIL